MGIFNTVSYKIIENFILNIGYIQKSQEGSHIKFDFDGKILIIPKHKEISRGTLNNIFKIISIHLKLEKSNIEKDFLLYYNKKY